MAIMQAESLKREETSRPLVYRPMSQQEGQKHQLAEPVMVIVKENPQLRVIFLVPSS